MDPTITRWNSKKGDTQRLAHAHICRLAFTNSSGVNVLWIRTRNHKHGKEVLSTKWQAFWISFTSVRRLPTPCLQMCCTSSIGRKRLITSQRSLYNNRKGASTHPMRHSYNILSIWSFARTCWLDLGQSCSLSKRGQLRTSSHHASCHLWPNVTLAIQEDGKVLQSMCLCVFACMLVCVFVCMSSCVCLGGGGGEELVCERACLCLCMYVVWCVRTAWLEIATWWTGRRSCGTRPHPKVEQ